jgi:hypothetical protein
MDRSYLGNGPVMPEVLHPVIKVTSHMEMLGVKNAITQDLEQVLCSHLGKYSHLGNCYGAGHIHKTHKLIVLGNLGK